MKYQRTDTSLTGEFKSYTWHDLTLKKDFSFTPKIILHDPDSRIRGIFQCAMHYKNIEIGKFSNLFKTKNFSMPCENFDVY